MYFCIGFHLTPSMTWKSNAILFIFLSCASLAWAGDPDKKILQAVKAEVAPKMDGYLDDPVWETAPLATDFIQHEPFPMAPSSEQTEVRVVYTDEAIYIGAMMYADQPDSILHQLTPRDDPGNSDFFGVWFSCFNDGINAFEFFVTPEGVQLDALVSSDNEDFNWNAVWLSEVRMTDEGWQAEIKIPYSAIRFPEADIQNWDINFVRLIRNKRERSFWHAVDPKIEGFINQSGRLEGLENITPPARLFFFPYVSAYYATTKEKIDNESGFSRLNDQSFNGGLDVKYGINDVRDLYTGDLRFVSQF